MKDIQSYSQEALSNVKQSNFLPEEDFSFLVDKKSELQEIFEKKKIWRSAIDMRVSVLDDVNFPDNASKYWQCVKECDVFYTCLIELSFQFRRNQLKLKFLLKELENTKNEFHREGLQIDIEEMEYIISNQILQSKDRVREIREWSKLMEELDDGSFSTSNIEESQLLSYAQSFVKKYQALKDHVTGSERSNIIGLLVTTLKKCEKDGVMDKLKEKLDDSGRKFILTLADK